MGVIAKHLPTVAAVAAVAALSGAVALATGSAAPLLAGSGLTLLAIPGLRFVWSVLRDGAWFMTRGDTED